MIWNISELRWLTFARALLPWLPRGLVSLAQRQPAKINTDHCYFGSAVLLDGRLRRALVAVQVMAGEFASVAQSAGRAGPWYAASVYAGSPEQP